jgi:hypothetical protein
MGLRVDDLLKQTPVGNFAAAHNSTVECFSDREWISIRETMIEG